MSLELRNSMDDYLYDDYLQKGINFNIECFELRIPNKYIDIFYLKKFFYENFDLLMNLKELRLTGINKNYNTRMNKELDRRFITNYNTDFRGFSFQKLEKLVLSNVYISLDSLEELLLITRNIDLNSEVFIDFNLEFEHVSSKKDEYTVKKYNTMSIQEESNFMLNSDYNNIHFNDNNSKNDEDYFFYNQDHYNHQYDIKPSFMQPFLDIKYWIIRPINSINHKFQIKRQKLNFRKYGILILDAELEEIYKKNLSDIYKCLISKTIIKYIVDPLKTVANISPSCLNISIGYDNLIYSGYVLNILYNYQRTIQNLTILSFLIPFDYFLELKMRRIQVLKISIFKDRDLEPKNLLDICSWVKSFGKNLTFLHIRLTGSSTKWIPKNNDIQRLELLWKKLCPLARNRESIKFECCYTDHIFGKMNFSNECDYENESD